MKLLINAAFVLLTAASCWSQSLQMVTNAPNASAPVVSPQVVNAISCHAATANPGTCTTAALSVTSGNSLLYCYFNANATSLSSLTISTGTDTLASFTDIFTPITTPQDVRCGFLLSTTASGSTTFKPTSSGNSASAFVVYQISGATALEATVAAPTVNAGPLSTVNCPSYTPTHTVLALCSVGTTSNVSPVSAGTGFTIATNGSSVTVGGGGGSNEIIEYKANVASGTVLNPTMNITSGSAVYAVTFAID